jgi:putative FmdB family regulatory protein
MPFYEYQCKQCGHELEAMQKVNDAPLKKCPECGKSALTRLMSAPVFRLKGAGWYETDFKSDDEGKRNLADKPEADAPKDEKKDEKKDDMKDDKKDSKEGAADAAAPAAKPVEKSDAPEPKKAAATTQTKSRVVAKPKAASGAKAAPKRPVARAKPKKTAKRARR